MIQKRRTKAGTLRYAVRIHRGGRQVWIGTFATLAEARKQEAKAKLTGQAQTRMTCDRFAEHFLEGYRQRVKSSSYATAESALVGFASDFRGIPLARVDAIRAQRWARKNAWRVPAVITLMNEALDAELIERNPFAGLARKGPGRKHTQPLSVAEIHELAAAAQAAHGPVIRGLVLFLAYTGLRVGEAFALTWEDVDFDRHRVHVERRLYRGELDLPKANRRRLAVLLPEARDALLGLPREARWVFTGKRGGQLSQSMLAWYWQGITASFPRKVTPHELRHFAAHHLYVTEGLPSRVVAAQLGHDGPKLIEQLYGHGDVGALEELDRALGQNVIPLRRASDG